MEKKKNPKRIICPDCKTGKNSYLIDENSPVCPYFDSYDGCNCAFYDPINGVVITEDTEDTENKKQGAFEKLVAFFKRNNRQGG